MSKNVIYHGLNMDWKTLNKRQIPIHLVRRNRMKIFCIGNCLQMIDNMHRQCVSWLSLVPHFFFFRHQSGMSGMAEGRTLDAWSPPLHPILSLHQLDHHCHHHCHHKQKERLFDWSVKILINSEGDANGCWFCLMLSKMSNCNLCF